MLVENASFEGIDGGSTGLPLGVMAAAGLAMASDAEVRTASRQPLRTLYSPVDGSIKRLLDILIATTLLVLFLPLLSIITVLVALDGGPVLFGHRRVGRDLRPFHCLKFRTMMLGAEPCLDEYLIHHPQARDEWEADQKLNADPRVTSIGKILRRTSLDELPQLLNVIAGNMSLVGPRPITISEIVRYGSDTNLYASVRPGLTGPWQISGRNDVGYAERVRLDASYVRNRNVLRDFLILTATPRVVLSRRGAK
jgi:exopolysaccharide production protein ExoY